MIEAELYENLSLNAKSSWVHGCLSAPKALSSSGEKSEANQERKVDMKWFGAMFFVAGIAWAYMWRHDPVEGQFMRPAGFLIAAFGFFYFFGFFTFFFVCIFFLFGI